jgi:hypothetical protein
MIEWLEGSQGCLSEYAGDGVVGMVFEARGVSISGPRDAAHGNGNVTYTYSGRLKLDLALVGRYLKFVSVMHGFFSRIGHKLLKGLVSPY